MQTIGTHRGTKKNNSKFTTMIKQITLTFPGSQLPQVLESLLSLQDLKTMMKEEKLSLKIQNLEGDNKDKEFQDHSTHRIRRDESTIYHIQHLTPEQLRGIEKRHYNNHK